jgi:hypothetical protein
VAIAWAMIVFGSILVVAGWKNLSVTALARGDASTPKPTVTAGAAPLTTTSG